MRRFASHYLMAICLLGPIFCLSPTLFISSAAQTGTTSANNATLAEARKIAAQIFNREFRKCGEHYYRQVASGLFSYADAKVDLDVLPMTKADELNGYQWKSWAILKYSAEAELDYQKRWSGWKPSSQSYPYPPQFAYINKKSNGEWEAGWNQNFATVEQYLKTLKEQPSCESIPPR